MKYEDVQIVPQPHRILAYAYGYGYSKFTKSDIIEYMKTVYNYKAVNVNIGYELFNNRWRFSCDVAKIKEILCFSKEIESANH